MAVPVNLRSEADPAGGNRFAGVNLAAPIGVADPEMRIQKIRSQMTRKREERAIDMVGAIAPVLSLLPDAVLEAMAGSVVNSDVQASNVPGLPRRHLHRRARRCCGSTALGPLPGVAMMVVLISRGGLLHGHHPLRPRGDRRRGPVRAVPAARVRRGARPGR